MVRNIFFVTLIFSAVLFLQNCTGEKQAESQTEQAVQNQPLEISADMLTTTTDLVCGMDLNEHAIKDTTIYKDQLYGFCSSYCKNKFVEAPETYLAASEK